MFANMSLAVQHDFGAFLTNRFGEALRGVVHYDGNDYEVAYLREDIAAQSSDEMIAAIAQDLSLVSFGKEGQEDLYQHGTLNCIIQHSDSAILIHFPYGEFKGTALTVDQGTFADQQSFVDECLTFFES